MISTPEVDYMRQKLAEKNKAAAPTAAAARPKDIDPRFATAAFRAAFHTVCEHLGLKPTLATFKQYDRKYGGFITDWRTFAESIVAPWHDARCYLLDRQGKRVFDANGFKTIGVKLHGATRKQALTELDTTIYAFKEWL